MQQFEADDPMDLQTTGVQRDMLFSVRTEGQYTAPMSPWPRDPEREERDTTSAQKRNLSIEDKARVTAGTSMESQLLQRHTSRVSE